jgi:hypothetical protein
VQIAVNFQKALAIERFLRHAFLTGVAASRRAERSAGVVRRSAVGGSVMAKDFNRDCGLDDLTEAEIERIEALVFCAGGPPLSLDRAIILRASLTAAPPRNRPVYG